MKISLFEELYESAPDGMKTMLFRQYRMHRDIAGLINRFYINTDAGSLSLRLWNLRITAADATISGPIIMLYGM